jgi:hypothetical protein
MHRMPYRLIEKRLGAPLTKQAKVRLARARVLAAIRKRLKEVNHVG